MSEPVTALDEPYSDPSAAATSWAETRQALEGAQLFWVSTVRPDGRPHVTPVVGAWADDAFWFSTGPGEQKFANLRANPQIVVTTGRNSWDGGLDVVVEGRAVQVSDDAVLARIAAAFATKWDGRWQYRAEGGTFRAADHDGEVMLFSVIPVKVWAYAKGDPFGATVHRFRP